MMRVMLYEAAQSMLRSKKWSWLKAWAMQIARRRGMKKAIVALVGRLRSALCDDNGHAIIVPLGQSILLHDVAIWFSTACRS
jgi:hypothetical protein